MLNRKLSEHSQLTTIYVTNVDAAIILFYTIFLFTWEYTFTSSSSRLAPGRNIHWNNVCLMLAHRLRRWPNNKPTLGQCVVFARIYRCLLYNLLRRTAVGWIEDVGSAASWPHTTLTDRSIINHSWNHTIVSTFLFRVICDSHLAWKTYNVGIHDLFIFFITSFFTRKTNLLYYPFISQQTVMYSLLFVIRHISHFCTLFTGELKS